MADANLQAKANGTRIARLLVDKGTEATRQTFDNIHPPATLAIVLTANKTLFTLRHRVINDSQWDLLYPVSGNPADSKTFDVTLLTVLLRNICGLAAPVTGWNNEPPDTDRSTEANIARIKHLRNVAYAHITNTEVNDTQFENLWQKISQALVDLGIQKNEIDELKSCPLSLEEETYVNKLKEWKLTDDECKESIDTMGNRIQGLEQATEKLRQVVLNQKSESSEKRKSDDEEILRKLAKHSFKDKITGAARSFHQGTRDWLFKQLDHWFADEGSRVMILTAGPGVGKSVFSGKVCQVYQETGKLAACHFCKFNDSNLRNPLNMIQSLASHMCDNVKGFKKKLLEKLGRPHQVKSLSDAFRVYLLEPLQELQEELPMLIVIDGLDESETNGKSELLDLIAEEFSHLPNRIKILVTSRPEIPVRKKLKDLMPIEILPSDRDNESDLHQYLGCCLPSLADTIIESLVKKCEGSFLFAFHAQSELHKRGNLADLAVDEINNFLPEGIGSVYENYFHRLQKGLQAMNKDLDLFKLLEILIAARGPLPLRFIADVLEMNADTRAMKKMINEVNEEISALLFVYDDLVTVFHKSVVDWLTSDGYEEHQYTVQRENGNKLLWRSCKKEFEEIKENIFDLKLSNEMKYSLEHAYSHLVGCDTNYYGESYAWLVDMVIVHVISEVHPQNVTSLKVIWKEALEQATDLNSNIRMKISWHLFYAEFSTYLQSVINESPVDCFSNEDIIIAKSILRKFTWCENLSSSIKKDNSIFVSKLFPSNITSINLLSDKKMVAVGQEDGTISFLELPEFNELWRHCTGSSVPCCTFSPQNSLLLYGKLDIALDVIAKKEVPFFCRNDDKFSSCAFSPSGRRLVTSDGSNTIKLWDVTAQSLLTLLSGGYPMDCCCFSKSGLFITGKAKECSRYSNNSDSLCIWNAISLQRIDQRNLSAKLGRDTNLWCDSAFSTFNTVSCNKCFQPTEDILFSTNKDDVDVYTLPNPSPAARMRSDSGTSMSVASYQNSPCVLLLNGESLRIIEPLHFTELAVLNFSRIFQLLLHSSLIGIIEGLGSNLQAILWEDADKLLVFNISPCEEEEASPWSSNSTHVVGCSFSPDGSRLATCTTDGFIIIWNVHTCHVVQRFSRCGRLAASCWWSKVFLLVFHFIVDIPILSKYPVDQQFIIRVAESKHHALDLTDVDISTFSEVLAFSEGVFIFKCYGRRIKVLDVNDIEDQKLIKLPKIEKIECFAVSPGGSFILGAAAGEFRIWRRNVKRPTEYEVWRENDFPSNPNFVIFVMSPTTHVIWEDLSNVA